MIYSKYKFTPSFGEHIFNNFLHVKHNEWNKYRTQVTKWESDYYMQIL